MPKRKRITPGSIYRRKNSKKLYVEYRDKSYPTGYDDTPQGRVRAQLFLQNLHDKWLNGGEPAVEQKHGVALQDAWKEFCKDHMAHKSKRTQASYRYSFAKICGKAKFDISTEKLHSVAQKFFNESKQAPSGRNIILRSFRVFCTWCTDKGYCEKVNFKRLMVKTQKPIRTYDDAELDKIINAFQDVSERHHLLFRFMRLTGSRLTETLEIRKSQIMDDHIDMRNKINKSEFDAIPITAELRGIINRALEINLQNDHLFHWTREGASFLYKSWRKVCENLGIENIGVHAIRKNFASGLIERGVELAHVKDLMRHKSVSTTLGHYHEFRINKLRSILESGQGSATEPAADRQSKAA